MGVFKLKLNILNRSNALNILLLRKDQLGFFYLL